VILIEFDIQDSPPILLANPNVKLIENHPSGKVAFHFHVCGFDIGEGVRYWVNTPRGTREDDSSYYGYGRTEGGCAIWDWTVPDDAPPGYYSMVVHGVQSKLYKQKVIPFEVPGGANTPPPSVLHPEPSIRAVDPKVGSAGMIFNFTANGVQKEETVHYWVTDQNGTVVGDDHNSFTAVESQVWWTWQSPNDAQPGTYTMVLLGDNSKRQIAITFEIR
jgi:hypothetical protein